MSLSEIVSREPILKAVREFDNLGRATFLEKYGFGPAQAYFLAFEGKLYDSKAIVGVAHRFACPDKGPLRSSEFEGGKNNAVKKLERLGFTVTVRRSPAVRRGKT